MVRARAEQLVDERLRAASDIGGVFALRNRRCPHGPVRHVRANIDRFAVFVDAVVPFVQIRLDPRALAEPRQPACFDGALHRAGEHEIERLRGEQRFERGGLRAAGVGERNIARAGVLAGLAPFGFPVANQPDLLDVRLAHGVDSRYWTKADILHPIAH